ncbi:hypothetical protein EDD21DRAFT_421146 [Dissophora ornata]|nr:hypothetical protein EDD21DRAFT_421146 [Dissophora ornata]
MTRQEPEGDGKVSRTCGITSAPLRLLSHSYHSTANTHSLGNNLTPSTTSEQIHTPDALPKESNVDVLTPQHPVRHVTEVHAAIVPRPASKLEIHHTNDPLDSNLQSTVPYSTFHHQQPPLHTAQAPHQTVDPRPSISRSKPQRKAAKIATRSRKEEAVKSAVVEHTCSDALQQSDDSRARLERLLFPYDIRYSIFRHLSLQDLYYCQLACKLLYWATSDQSIWKRIALNLIQGEFYFDIPKALPANIPNWKFFCKRHLLRQRNWRQGQVQDVILLNDDYKKLTTLQIMAPYVLTGCDDGRIHLWNIRTRTFLHRFQIRGEITWVEHLQEQKIVAGLGYDIEKTKSEIRLFSTESGEEIGFYKEDFWKLAICAINAVFLAASDGDGRYTTWDWRTGAKVSHFKVENEVLLYAYNQREVFFRS